MSVRVGFNAIVPQTCGVGILGIFRGIHEGYGTPLLEDVTPPGGCGWIISSFTQHNPAYKQAYIDMCKKWKLVYQSEVRTNTRTKRQFFFCIFDTRTKP